MSTCERVGAQIRSLGKATGGLAGGFEAAGARIRRGALGRGCGREGSGALPLLRAAVISTRLRVRALSERGGLHRGRELHRPTAPRPTEEGVVLRLLKAQDDL